MKKPNEKRKIAVLILLNLALFWLVSLSIELNLDFWFNWIAGITGIYVLDDFMNGWKKQKGSRGEIQ